MSGRTGAARAIRVRDRAARRATLYDLLARIDRLTPAERMLLVDYAQTELAASDALRSSLVGVERALQERTEQLVAAEAAIVEAEQDRDRAAEALAAGMRAWHQVVPSVHAA
ncbi:hypothetical protein [Streptomyces sp. NPDC047981]|uniref:hypothetical protein n=1 Tax=Streptomyces sp. NPDC047981 TaxID=3154610 RepID=UPI00343B75F7